MSAVLATLDLSASISAVHAAAEINRGHVQADAPSLDEHRSFLVEQRECLMKESCESSRPRSSVYVLHGTRVHQASHFLEALTSAIMEIEAA
jgi:hypothetical protein